MVQGESKNIKRPALTTQLRDYTAHAAKTPGMVFHLYAREGTGTTLTTQVREFITENNIKLHKVIPYP